MRKLVLVFAPASLLALAALSLLPRSPASPMIFVAQAALLLALLAALAGWSEGAARGVLRLILVALLQVCAIEGFLLRESALESQDRAWSEISDRLGSAALTVAAELEALWREADARASAALSADDLEGLAQPIRLSERGLEVAISLWEDEFLLDWAGDIPGVEHPQGGELPLLVDHGYRRVLSVSASDSLGRTAFVDVDLGISRELFRRLGAGNGPERALQDQPGGIEVELRPTAPPSSEIDPRLDRVIGVPLERPWIHAILRSPGEIEEQQLMISHRGTVLARWWLASAIFLCLLALRRWPRFHEGQRGSWLLPRVEWIAVALILLFRFLLDRGGLLFAAIGDDLPRLALLVEPAYFASRFGFGLMRNAVALLATGLTCGAVAVLLLPGWLRWMDAPRGSVARRLGLLALLALAVALAPWTAKLQEVVAQNANAKLSGVSAPFFTLPFLVLHVGLLLLILAPAGFVLLGFERWLRQLRRHPLALSIALWALLLAIGVAFTRPTSAGWCSLLLPLAWAIQPLLRERAFARRVVAALAAVLWLAALQSSGFESVYLRIKENVQRSEAQERLQPPQNWREYLLEDLLKEIASDPERLRELADPELDRSNAAFELWAASSLAPLRYASRVELQGRDGRVVSRFDFGLPYDPRPLRGWQGTPGAGQDSLRVERLNLSTESGRFQIYRGSLRLDRLQPQGDAVLLTVDLPFATPGSESEFDLSVEAPIPLGLEEDDALAPRREFDRPVLWGRVEGERMSAASDSRLLDLSVERLPESGSWTTLRLGTASHRLGYFSDGPESGLVVAFELSSLAERLLDFSRLVALYTLAASLVLLGLMLLRAFRPRPRRIWPSILGDFGFQERLLGLVVLVVLLPLLLSAAFQQRQVASNLRQEHLQDVRQRLFAAQSLITSSLDDLAAALIGGEYVQQILNEERSLAPRDLGPYERSQVMVFDPDGQLRLDESLRDFDFEESRAFLDRVIDGQLVLESEYDGWYVGRLYPVRGPGGEAFSVFVRRQLLDEDLAGIARTINAEVTLYDGPWAVLSSQDHLLRAGLISPVLPRPVHRELFEGRRSIRVQATPQSGLMVGSGFVTLAGVELAQRGVLQVRLFASATEAALEEKRLQLFLFGLSSLAFLLAIAVALWISGRIVGPLRLLVDATQRIGGGALDLRLPARAQDEFGQLMRSFNQMTEDLQEGQRRLAARRSYLESVLSNLSAGVLVLDDDGEIAERNNAAERLLEDRAEEFHARVRGQLPSDRLVSLEITLRPRIFRTVIDPVQREDLSRGYLVLFDDVSELLANRQLSLYAEMARQVAHEIKNPLTPIQLAAQMVRQAIADRHPRMGEIVGESVDTIELQVERLRGIVSEFSMLGRVEALQLSPTNAGELLTEIQALYPSPDGRLRIEVDAEAGMQLLCEREALLKTLSNLVENARQAMSGQGTILLSAQARGEQVRLLIEDEGPGISPDIEERIFEPYFSTKSTGTGLGLVICRSLVERMGGSLHLRNRPGGAGALAEILLPRHGAGPGNESG